MVQWIAHQPTKLEISVRSRVHGVGAIIIRRVCVSISDHYTPLSTKRGGFDSRMRLMLQRLGADSGLISLKAESSILCWSSNTCRAFGCSPECSRSCQILHNEFNTQRSRSSVGLQRRNSNPKVTGSIPAVISNMTKGGRLVKPIGYIL